MVFSNTRTRTHRRTKRILKLLWMEWIRSNLGFETKRNSMNIKF
jgi:hypothetical protein